MRSRSGTLFCCLILLVSPGLAQRRSAPGPRPKSPNSTLASNSNASLSGPYNVSHAYDEGNVEFKSETVLVQVPMVVSDKSGTHVHGLGRADFGVLEDGRAQKIATFEEVEPTRSPLALPHEKNSMRIWLPKVTLRTPLSCSPWIPLTLHSWINPMAAKAARNHGVLAVSVPTIPV